MKFENDKKDLQEVREDEWELEKNNLYEPHITLFETSLDNMFTLHLDR